MSISGISANSSQVESAEKASQRRQYSQDLASSIESGNVSGAQQAFAQLLQTNLNNETDSAVNNDIQSLDNALKSGDITSVKNAFATLQRDTESNSPAFASSLQPGNLTAAQKAYASLDTYLLNGSGNDRQKEEHSWDNLTGITSYGAV